MSKSHTKTFKKNLLTTALTLATATTAQAGIVRGDVDYQYFRDFAENKGQFGLNGNNPANVEIFDKQGNSVGTMLDGIPMIDLAVGNRGRGYATLVKPQYVVSVQHNVGYKDVQFGDHSDANPDSHHFDYQVVDRHIKAPGVGIRSWHRDDYHSPRLHKLVTEVAPIATADETSIQAYLDKDKYPVFVRSGSGKQMALDKGKIERDVAGTYQYVTGGSMLDLVEVVSDSANIPGETKNTLMRIKGYDNMFNHPLGIMQKSGDSGSGVFAWDAKAQRWVYAMSVQSSTNDNSFSIVHLGYADENEKKAIAGEIVANAKNLIWTPVGNTSTITGGQTDLTVGLYDPDLLELDGARNDKDVAVNQWHRPRQNAGKTFTITGDDNVLKLTSDVNQGAGAIYFKGNTTVEGATDDTTWLGAGVSIDKDKTVTWKVHNPENDRLSKLGEGVMLVQGVGKNLGSISVGEGKVILDQKADSRGQKQAFDEVGIVSGRPTVVLNSADQVNPNNIYFGFRGGRLDVNGNDLTFNRIQNADSGAKIVNNNMTKATNITIATEYKELQASDIKVVNGRSDASGTIFMNDYRDGYIDYYVLKPNGKNTNNFPQGKGNENPYWEWLGSNRDEAVRKYLDRENTKRLNAQAKDAFVGMLGDTDNAKNGQLNFTYNPDHKDNVYMLSGGTNLNGNLTVQNGTILLSGTPTPHAYDHINKTEVIDDGDWIDREFKATTFEVTNGTLKTGRNVAKITGDIDVSGTGVAQIGYVSGDEVYTRTRTGAVVGEKKAYTDEVLASILGQTKIEGNISLRDKAELRLNTAFDRHIRATADTTTRLESSAHWVMPSSQTIGHLDGDNGQITLNARNQHTAVVDGDDYNTLTVKGNLDGHLHFNYLTDLANKKSDKLVVEGYATGSHTLAVQNTGNEAKVAELTLVSLKHGGQNAQDVDFNLKNGFVDAGSLRYTLQSDDAHRYYLFNPEKANEIKQKRDEEARKAEEEAQKARQALTDAINAKTEAERKQKEAEDALKQALANGGANAQDVANAQKLAEQALADKQKAEEQLAEVREQLNQANTAKEQAETLKNQANADLQTARDEQARLQTALDNANRAKETAEQAKADAENAKRLAEQQAQTAQNEKAQAETKQREAEAKQQEAETQRATAETALAEANRLKENAEKALLDAQTDGGKALADAQKALEDAKKQVADKELELTNANDAKAQAERQKAQAERQRDDAQNALTQAQNALTQANEQKNQAIEQARLAENQKQAVEQNLSTVQAQLTQAQNDKATAEQKARDAETARNNAELAKQALEQAQTAQAEALKNAKEALKVAQNQKQSSDLAKAQAEQAQKLAEAEANRQATLAKQANTAKQIAEQLASTAKQAQTLAEQAKAQADLARQKADEANLALTQANERLQATITADAITIAKAKEELALAQKQADDRQALLDLAKDNLTQINAKLADIEAQNHQISEQLAQEKILREQAELAQAQAKLAKDEADKARQLALDAQSKSDTEKQEAQTNLVKAEQLAKDAQTQAEQAEQALAVMADELAQAQAKLSAKQADLAVSDTQIKELQAKQEVADTELAHLKAIIAQQQAEALANQANQQKQADIISQYANTALSELSATAHHLHRVGDRIDDRLHHLNGNNSGVWLQTDTEKTKHSSDQYRTFEQDSQLTQIGVDKTTELDNGKLTLGGSLNHLTYDADYDDNFKGEGRTITGTIYGKWHTPSGFAITSDVSAGQAKSEIHQDNRTTDLTRNITSVGMGISKTFNTGDKAGNLDVQTHAGVRRYLLGDTNYAITASDNTQVQVKQDDINITSYQAGVNVGKTLHTPSGLTIRPNMGISYRHTGSDATIIVNDHALTQKFANEVQSQAGLTIGKGNFEMQLQADYAKNNESGDRTGAMVGVSWGW